MRDRDELLSPPIRDGEDPAFRYRTRLERISLEQGSGGRALQQGYLLNAAGLPNLEAGELGGRAALLFYSSVHRRTITGPYKDGGLSDRLWGLRKPQGRLPP